MSKRYQAGILGVGFNPLQAPDAPTIGAATAGNQNVSVAFTAPADVGGSAISSYRVRATPGGIGATTSSSPVTVSGLTNGTTYTFSVAAVNSYGFSPYSGTATATPVAPAIEDFFSTWLYTGNGSTQTITNGINLSGQGGLVWAKSRVAGNSHILTDTARGAANTLATNFNGAQNALETNALSSFNSNGFTLNNSIRINASGEANVSWTFRKAPNFFDVVTYTGDGVAGREIAHNLGVSPGMVIAKRTDSAADWVVWQNSLSDPSKYLVLNTTAATAADNFGPWGPYGGGYTTNASSFTSTFFRVANDARSNAGGSTYVAYLFAHVPGSDGLIQCGSYTGNGSSTGPVVTLGWEPQWLLIKGTNTTTDWLIVDNMRGLPVGSAANVLYPNNAFSEATWPLIDVAATGFQIKTSDGAINNPGTTYIYMAIRRGPMRTPTLGTSVFAAQANGNSLATPPYIAYNSNFPIDMFFQSIRAGGGTFLSSRLTAAAYMGTYSTAAEAAGGETVNGTQTGVLALSSSNLTGRSAAMFRRAPGFMDVVCYTGTGTNGRTVAHNLGVAPEMIILKSRSISSSASRWPVYTPALLASASNNSILALNSDSGIPFLTKDVFGNTAPTSSVFTVDALTPSNEASATYVAYLFASCPGVSKVGSYTGNGSSQTINCAFTTGARFVLIKRTDSTGDWYVWDSARGIVAGNDPYLALNSTAAEVTSNDSVDTDSTGFIVNQVAASNINVNAATYIFLAIS